MPFWKCFSCVRFPNEENVTKLDYSNGTLNDVPPDISQFERTLEELYLSSNRISDLPPELFYCQDIRVLKLNDNELETIPNAIGSLRQLQVLDLSRNALTYIPDNIKSCKHLTHLDLSLNNLQRLPDAITSLISLQELLLNETFLEFLPANFGRLVNLKILELRSNNLITLPKSMARLTTLERIDIGANEFTELPEVIGHLTQLKELWIDYNRIRRISTNISNLRELIHFEANSNQLTSLPNEISHWRNLEVLSLSTNDLENLPFSIGMLKRLITIKCDSNQLRELPDSICHLDNLEEMVISHNYIMRLPSTIGLLRKLRFLSADENLLRRLPDEICSCSSLSVLSLRGNKLIELPNDIGHLTNLKVLNIVNNSISYLPASILNLSNLTALWISDNQSQPLVPLQYLDSNTKTQLTCFMLPQTLDAFDQTARSQYENRINTLSLEYSDNSSINSYIHLQQQQQQQQQQSIKNHNNGMTGLLPQQQQSAQSQHQQNRNNFQIGSPSKRICFADESGTRLTTDPITTRLMRSPTPYPKELRLMAKYVKHINHNNHHSHHNRGDNIEMVSPQKIDDIDLTKYNNEQQQQGNLRIKEARVLSKPGGGGGGGGGSVGGVSQNLTNTNHDNMYDEKLLPTSNITATSNCDMPSAQINYYYNTLNNSSDSNPNNYINLHQNLIIAATAGAGASSNASYDTTDGQIPLINPIHTSDIHYHNHMQQQPQHHHHNQSYADYNDISSFNNSIHNIETALNWRAEPLYDIRLQPNIIQQQQQHHQQQQLHQRIPSQMQRTSEYIQQQQQQQQQHHPPPYDIAKTFTKKSREDLLNYDTLRNQIEHHLNGSLLDHNVNDDDENDDEINADDANNDDDDNDENGESSIIKNEINDNFNSLKYNERNNDRCSEISCGSNNNNNSSGSNNNSNNNASNEYLQNGDAQLNGRICSVGTIAVDTLSRSPILVNLSENDVNAVSVACSATASPNSSILNGYEMEQHKQHINSHQHQQQQQQQLQQLQQQQYMHNYMMKTPSKITSQWLFGLHKNPTVKQVVIKKDPILGFEIKEIPNHGIFVSITIPNTSAFHLLRVDDKILDVDGFDFSKVNLEEARQVLIDSGPVLNVMISRK